MPTIDQRLQSLGLVVVAPLQLPPGMALPFPWVRVFGLVKSAPGSIGSQPLSTASVS